jgi:hypothetical protein
MPAVLLYCKPSPDSPEAVANEAATFSAEVFVFSNAKYQTQTQANKALVTQN